MLQRRRPKLQQRRRKGAALRRELPLAEYPVGEGLLLPPPVARTSQLQRRRLSRDRLLGDSGQRLAISRPRQFLRRGRMLMDCLVPRQGQLRQGQLRQGRLRRRSNLVRSNLVRPMRKSINGISGAASPGTRLLTAAGESRQMLAIRVTPVKGAPTETNKVSHDSFQDYTIQQRMLRRQERQRQMKSSRSEVIAGSSEIQRWTRPTGHKAKVRTSGTRAADVSVDSAECT